MILAVVDDLLFSSKIRATAERAGRSVVFVRSRSDVVPEIRTRKPSLVIFDLDRPSLDAISAIAEIKAQPELASLPLIGFVSHVRADIIDAARRAGIDQVLARSAFVAKLPELVAAAPHHSSAPE